MRSAGYWIEKLGLLPHPEGGFYREHYRSAESMHFNGVDRPVSTAIWFLMPERCISAWHRLDADELWHFYEGGPLLIHAWKNGGLTTHRLGEDGCLNVLMRANTWFATEPAAGAGFSLCGCTVAPGFTFERFEMATLETVEKEGWTDDVRRLIKR